MLNNEAIVLEKNNHDFQYGRQVFFKKNDNLKK